ncbi:MAG: hypothetical protein OEW02_09180, partial [Myxococcales bacterium]|nr:hypothetical protein [Myxococcales bacterium]
DILESRSADGVSWSAPAPLNSYAAGDSRGDYAPQLTTDGAGIWVAVWSGLLEINADRDILVARPN